MTNATFEKLLDLFAPSLHVNGSKAGIQLGVSFLVVAYGLRFLGGEPHKSICDAFHPSLASSQRVVSKFFDAVVNCDALSIHLPIGNEFEELAAGWTQKSTAKGIVQGFVLAYDGFLPTRIKPNDEEVVNTEDYLSGHKKT